MIHSRIELEAILEASSPRTFTYVLGKWCPQPSVAWVLPECFFSLILLPYIGHTRCFCLWFPLLYKMQTSCFPCDSRTTLYIEESLWVLPLCSVFIQSFLWSPPTIMTFSFLILSWWKAMLPRCWVLLINYICFTALNILSVLHENLVLPPLICQLLF